jgi:hypothetical protein
MERNRITSPKEPGGDDVAVVWNPTGVKYINRWNSGITKNTTNRLFNHSRELAAWRRGLHMYKTSKCHQKVENIT